MGVIEKIQELEEEIRRTQKNKATEVHIGLLKAKIAKLRRAILSAPKSNGGPAYQVKKSGDGVVSLIGFPSVGKSTLLVKITNAKSKTASYDFTTLKCIPGMLYHKGAKIQILDLPGIIQGAKEGRGRGKEVIGVARNSDLILILIDARYPHHYDSIVKELGGMGIRLNQKPPEVIITKKIRGGLSINTCVKLTKINVPIITSILGEYGIHNADVVLREDIDADQLIDVLEGNRVYIPALVAMNKIDLVNQDDLKRKVPYSFIPISAEKNLNLEKLIDEIYKSLNFIRIYTKPQDGKADLNEPLIVKEKTKISEICTRLHKMLLRDFKYACVWGKSVKYPAQRVGLDHIVMEGDIVSIITVSPRGVNPP